MALKCDYSISPLLVSTWYLANPGNMRALTDSPALFIPPRMIGKFKESMYATVYLCSHVIGFLQFSGFRRAVCEDFMGSTMMCDMGCNTCSMLRPTITELSTEVTRTSVQALVKRTSWKNSWTKTRIFMAIGYSAVTIFKRMNIGTQFNSKGSDLRHG